MSNVAKVVVRLPGAVDISHVFDEYSASDRVSDSLRRNIGAAGARWRKIAIKKPSLFCSNKTTDSHTINDPINNLWLAYNNNNDLLSIMSIFRNSVSV